MWAVFIAQYRQAAPQGLDGRLANQYEPRINDRKNLTGEDNYVFLEAVGKDIL